MIGVRASRGNLSLRSHPRIYCVQGIEPVESLVEVFAGEATRRGLFDPSRSQIDLETAFALVREISYLRTSDREPCHYIEGVVRDLFGEALSPEGLLEELGYEVRLMA